MASSAGAVQARLPESNPIVVGSDRLTQLIDEAVKSDDALKADAVLKNFQPGSEDYRTCFLMIIRSACIIGASRITKNYICNVYNADLYNEYGLNAARNGHHQIVSQYFEESVNRNLPISMSSLQEIGVQAAATDKHSDGHIKVIEKLLCSITVPVMDRIRQVAIKNNFYEVENLINKFLISYVTSSPKADDKSVEPLTSGESDWSRV